MDYTLLDLNAIARSIGRASIFYASKWSGAADLTLTHLGDTEGEITITTNENYIDQTAPEVTGSAVLARRIQGLNPRVEFSLVLATPATLAIVSPTGTAGAGYSRSVPVTERTLWIVPELLFLGATNLYTEKITYSTAGGWKKGTGAAALTTEEQRLLDLSIWFWRGHFEKALPVYNDDGKAVVKCGFQVMQSDLATSLIPEGQRLFTVGSPAAASIVIDVA